MKEGVVDRKVVDDELADIQKSVDENRDYESMYCCVSVLLRVVVLLFVLL